MPPIDQSTLRANLYMGEFSQQIQTKCIYICQIILLLLFYFLVGMHGGNKQTQNILHKFGQQVSMKEDHLSPLFFSQTNYHLKIHNFSCSPPIAEFFCVLGWVSVNFQ